MRSASDVDCIPNTGVLLPSRAAAARAGLSLHSLEPASDKTPLSPAAQEALERRPLPY